MLKAEEDEHREADPAAQRGRRGTPAHMRIMLQLTACCLPSLPAVTQTKSVTGSLLATPGFNTRTSPAFWMRGAV